MRIAVGTLNKGKVEAVAKACEEYPMLNGAEVCGVEVDSGVASQPIGLEEIMMGAKNRARLALESGEYELGIGLESGIFLVPHTKSEYMDTTACAIYDGKEFHLGMSACFEYPLQMVKKVLQEKKSISEAAVEMDFAQEESFREGLGMIGVLTKARINRMDYSYQAVQMALIHLENSEHY
ncbi:MAG: inosine/xanthosine triphosphatase [Candidatus Altimarinota bacterium]